MASVSAFFVTSVLLFGVLGSISFSKAETGETGPHGMAGNTDPMYMGRSPAPSRDKKGVRCSSLSNPSNGKVLVSRYSVGGCATYSCNTGFAISGSSHRYCGSSGTWSGSPPSCQGVCPTPSPPSNGRVCSSGPYFVWRQVTYACNSGYGLLGSPYQTCGSNCRWSGSKPSCKRVCPTPSPPSNGRVSSSGPYFVWRQVTYTCNSGYGLFNGSPYQTCGSNYRWSGSKPSCKRILCQSPHCPSNGRVTVYANGYMGGNAHYSCDSGYGLSGCYTRACRSDGTWSGYQPSCQRLCPRLSAPTNGRVHVTYYHPGGRATYTCNNGYRLSSSSYLTCSSNGKWSGSKPSCLNMNECSLGTHNCAQRCTNTDGSFFCSCFNGYRLNSDQRTCRSCFGSRMYVCPA